MQMKTLECCVQRVMLYAASFSEIPSSSSFDLSAAMAQISTPNTAFATTSAIEYPICSPAVAVTPEMPSILMMYTKGYVNQEMIVSHRAYPVRDDTDAVMLPAALS